VVGDHADHVSNDHAGQSSSQQEAKGYSHMAEMDHDREHGHHVPMVG